jgi:tripartite-type tricarboxylate transporter receptor subunit TctC
MAVFCMRRHDFNNATATIAAAGLLAVLAANLSAAKSARAVDYPTRPVTLVVPLSPGGAADTVGRIVAHHLSERLGHPFVVENRPGAGTVIGATAVARAAPDGYTLMVAGSGTLTTNVIVYRKLPYDPAKDFSFIAHTTNVPLVLVVNTSLPIQSLPDLIRRAKEKPNQFAYASSGPGTSNHLAGELLKSMGGIEMAHVPYKGPVAALADVVAGHLPLMFADAGSALPLIRDGKVRALAVSSADRIPGAPEIPTVAETGVPGFSAISWHMIVAPAQTPNTIVETLRTELRQIMGLPEVQQTLASFGLVPVISPSEDELKKFIAGETVVWGNIVRQVGLAGSQ